MRTRVMRGAGWCRTALFLSFLGAAGMVIAQAPPASYGEERPPWLVMIGRVDPADPTRYVGVFDDQSQAVAFFRGGQRVPVRVPQLLERGDELETAKDVMAVIRYPIGDVYVDAGTRVRIGSLDVLFGRVFARVKGFFSVENQNVVAGVEGTEFAFEVQRDGNTEITVLDGTVLSSSKKLPWKPLRVTRNQAFWVTNSGMQIKVGAAPPNDLARIRRWVGHADTAVAAIAPREALAQPAPQPPPAPEPPPQPAPTPLQPIPPPMPQPVPQPAPPPLVVPIPVPVPVPARVGFCCANGRVFESTAAQCRGVFSYDHGRVRESCRPPPPPAPGYCCVGGELISASRDRCKGNFYTDAATARRLCAAPPPMGYCCAAGQVQRMNRSQCRGSYYVDEATARKACTAPPSPDPVGKGKVTTPAPKPDGVDKSKAVVTKPNPSAVDKSKAVITSPGTSEMIKKPPPPDPPIKLNRLPVTAPTAFAHRARWS